jgi:hypothetical protein
MLIVSSLWNSRSMLLKKGEDDDDDDDDNNEDDRESNEESMVQLNSNTSEIEGPENWNKSRRVRRQLSVPHPSRSSILPRRIRRTSSFVMIMIEYRIWFIYSH